MSLKLTTSLSQRLVLTPQLRQRIEMLQMTTLELTDLIQQQILENPVLEEVATQEEVGELAEKILDHLASSDPGAAPDEPQRLGAGEHSLDGVRVVTGVELPGFPMPWSGSAVSGTHPAPVVPQPQPGGPHRSRQRPRHA